ncbi:F-box/kelch-repeat protein At1g57790-like [Andrographis paniculata]|uniref:F-box/kelch-repeat protein At1g57790-like n=1 Tax=Andrographis paniculata TaxID=175694 RepID=UPI0021E6E26A|nr:F-box/kelch-repeat protein At1g57790-like [Andrographis paniculata]
MARGQRKSNKKLKFSFEEKRNKKRILSTSTEQDQELDFYLPTDVLVLIFTLLSFRDTSRAAGVCRRWRAAAATVQNLGKPPLLLHLPRYGYQRYKFFDLSLSRSDSLSLPICRRGKLYYVRDRWMLFFKASMQTLTLFCPYTRESVQLPRLSEEFKGAAFSGLPKSPDCVVFAITISEHTHATISSCRPGDDTWTTVTYQSQHPFHSCIWSCVVACNGCFYCMSPSGHVGVYDPMQRTWTVFNGDHDHLVEGISLHKRRWFTAEHSGDIFLVRTCVIDGLTIYKLDQTEFNWLKVTDFGGLTIFVSPKGSYIKDNMPGRMRDCIFFSEDKYFTRYSLHHGRYFSDCFIRPKDTDEAVWIDAPEDNSVLEGSRSQQASKK